MRYIFQEEVDMPFMETERLKVWWLCFQIATALYVTSRQTLKVLLATGDFP